MVIKMTSFTHATIIKSQPIRSCRFASDKETCHGHDLRYVILFADFSVLIEHIYISISLIKYAATRCKKYLDKTLRFSLIRTKVEKFQGVHIFVKITGFLRIFASYSDN